MASFLSYIRGLSLGVAHWEAVTLIVGLVLTVGLIYWSARTSRLMMPSRRRTALVVITGLTLLALSFSFAELTHTKKVKRLAVALLVDGSASIPDDQLQRARQWVEQAYQMHGETWIRTVAFGRTPILLPAADQAPAIQRPDQQPGTDISRAVHSAIELLPEDYTHRVVLLTDGNQTDGDLLAEASIAAAHGVTLDPVVLDTRAENDLYLESIHVPAAARPGERVKVGVVVVSNYATTAHLTIMQGAKSVFAQNIAIEPGRSSYEAETIVSGAGAANFVAQATADNDQHPDNNRLSASVRLDSEPKVMLFSEKPDEDLALVEALDAARIKAQIAGVDAMPSAVGALLNYDVVLLSDVDYTRLAAAKQEALINYVKDGGGGLLVVGGERTGELGQLKKKIPVLRMMPVVFKEKKKTEPNPVSLILVIDKSASMSRERKFAMAVQAANETIQMLAEKSNLGVILFDDFPRWAIPMQKVGDDENKKKMQELLRTFGVDGGTSIYPAINEAYKKLKDDPAKVKHIILLSDGISITTFEQWGHVIQWMASKKITISSVALGKESDQAHLRHIAEVGRGRYYFTEDFAQIPRIFMEETKTITKKGAVEKKIQPELLKKGDLLEGMTLEPIPEILGYNTADPKPTSEVFLTAERGDPLLARWRFGLGKVAVLLTDNGKQWALNWRTWPQYSPLLARLVRGALPDLALRNYAIAATTNENQAQVSVDATDQYGNFVNDMQLLLKVTTPTGETRDVTLTQERAGGYQGAFEVTDFGAYALRVVPQSGALVRSQGLGQVQLAPPREFVAATPDRSLLAKVAAATQGKLNPTPAEVFAEPEVEFPQRRPLWNIMLYLALGGMLIGLLVRRG